VVKHKSADMCVRRPNHGVGLA